MLSLLPSIEYDILLRTLKCPLLRPSLIFTACKTSQDLIEKAYFTNINVNAQSTPKPRRVSAYNMHYFLSQGSEVNYSQKAKTTNLHDCANEL